MRPIVSAAPPRLIHAGWRIANCGTITIGAGVAELDLQGTSMTASQQQRGWLRLAFAATAFALLVMMVSNERLSSARASACVALAPAPGSPAFAGRWTRWEWPEVTHRTGADCVAWSAILPVLFVGLLAPLALVYVSLAAAGAPSAAHHFPSLFQRPPPSVKGHGFSRAAMWSTIAGL